ncbi:TOR complex subunit lst8 [Arachnomyces sp. PD_36]|nr:TOR complex subunit lst8 [Arachnomyces sp. PD_36]
MEFPKQVVLPLKKIKSTLSAGLRRSAIDSLLLLEDPTSKVIMSVILCTAGYDHTIRFWEALSGICSRTIQHPESQVNRLCITPDKRFLAAAGRHHVKLFDIKSTNPNPAMTFEGHGGNITGVAFHCEGKWMVTSSEDGTVKVWDTRTGSQQRNYVHKAAVNDVVIHPNQGELISCDASGTIRVWDLAESCCTHQLIPEEGISIASVSVASDGSLLCAGNNKGNVYIWRMLQEDEVTKIVPVAKFQAHKDYLTRVLLSPDVKHLATCSADHTARVWALDPEYGPAKELAKENAAKVAAGVVDKSPQKNGTSNEDAVASPSPVQNDFTLANVVSSQAREIWKHGEELKDSDATPTAEGSASKENDASTHFPALPDGPPIDPSTNSLFLEATLTSHQRWVWDCAFSADSAYLVTVCSDHYARLWELSTGSIIRQYSGHHRGCVCVALNDYSEPR